MTDERVTPAFDRAARGVTPPDALADVTVGFRPGPASAAALPSSDALAALLADPEAARARLEELRAEHGALAARRNATTAAESDMARREAALRAKAEATARDRAELGRRADVLRRDGEALSLDRTAFERETATERAINAKVAEALSTRGQAAEARTLRLDQREAALAVGEGEIVRREAETERALQKAATILRDAEVDRDVRSAALAEAETRIAEALAANVARAAELQAGLEQLEQARVRSQDELAATRASLKAARRKLDEDRAECDRRANRLQAGEQALAERTAALATAAQEAPQTIVE